jgi:hypothetical protein
MQGRHRLYQRSSLLYGLLSTEEGILAEADLLCPVPYMLMLMQRYYR